MKKKSAKKEVKKIIEVNNTIMEFIQELLEDYDFNKIENTNLHNTVDHLKNMNVLFRQLEAV